MVVKNRCYWNPAVNFTTRDAECETIQHSDNDRRIWFTQTSAFGWTNPAQERPQSGGFRLYAEVHAERSAYHKCSYVGTKPQDAELACDGGVRHLTFQ